MRRWAMFQHDSPQFLLCSTVILVTQSCLWINNNATFCLHSVGCFLAHLKLSYFTPLENILVEKITAFILCVFQVHAVSQDLLTTY